MPFARELAALDDIGSGRLTLGIGAGGVGADATVLGEPVLAPRDRAARLEEFVELLHLVLTSPSTTWRGRHYAAATTTLACQQQPRLPFVVAANGPRTMRLAARYGAGWVTTGTYRRDSGVDDETWWSGVAAVAGRFDEVMDEAGRDPLTVDRMLSVDAAPTFSLTSLETFTDAVGRAAELGFSDVVVHWPLPGAPVYAAPESVLDDVAAALPAVRSP